MQNTWSCSSLVLNKNKKTERKPIRRTKSAPCFRVGSGGELHAGHLCRATFWIAWLDWDLLGEIIYVYIFIQLMYTYICRHTDTRHTPPPTTTTPHMLVTGTRIKRDNKDTARAEALALKIYSVPELGFVPPSLGNLKRNILLTQTQNVFQNNWLYDT